MMWEVRMDAWEAWRLRRRAQRPRERQAWQQARELRDAQAEAQRQVPALAAPQPEALQRRPGEPERPPVQPV